MPNAPLSMLPNPASYNVSVTNVVTDRVTGLVWEGKLSWELSHAQAEAYCEGLQLGGSDAWRMPTLLEVISIVQNYINGEIDRVFEIGDLSGRPQWTSTKDLNGQVGVAYHLVGIAYINPAFLGRVQCVR